jgi:mannose-6-phosphate isomerase-like protein (cupin superfamily)
VPASLVPDIVLENRHTGERLAMQRIERDGQPWIALSGSLPPHRPGPPLHVHHAEAEEFHVVAGTLSAEMNGQRLQLGPRETVTFPPGAAHRWWNDGDEMLRVDGYVKPAVDLDRYLQAAFEVINAGAPDRPPMFYMAHLAWRHRRTQAALLMPRPLQMIVLPLVVLVGTILGRYRGTGWPGSPSRDAVS